MSILIFLLANWIYQWSLFISPPPILIGLLYCYLFCEFFMYYALTRHINIFSHSIGFLCLGGCAFCCVKAFQFDVIPMFWYFLFFSFYWTQVSKDISLRQSLRFRPSAPNPLHYHPALKDVSKADIILLNYVWDKQFQFHGKNSFFFLNTLETFNIFKWYILIPFIGIKNSLETASNWF